jgi:hypothetical protein
MLQYGSAGRYKKRLQLAKLREREDSRVNIGTRVTFQKTESGMSVIEKAMRMNERDLIAIAKTDAISKSELSQLIDDKAQALRKDGESREMAFTRYITTNPEGRDLFAICKAAPGPDHRQAAAIEFAKAESRPRRLAPLPGDAAGHPGQEDPEAEGDAYEPPASSSEYDAGVVGATNPYHETLRHLSSQEAKKPHNKNKSPEQIYTELATRPGVGQKLMAYATQWDLQRQGNPRPAL